MDGIGGSYVAPDLAHEVEGRRVVFLQLGPNERIEVVHAEVRLSHLGEEFLVVGSSVMLHFAA